MRMIVRFEKRVRVATAIKAFLMLRSGATFNEVSSKYAKGSNEFLNGMLTYLDHKNVLDNLKQGNNDFLIDKLGVEYITLRNEYLNLLDKIQGNDYRIKFHYYTSHNTKSKSIYKNVRSFSKSRAQELLLKSVGGDAVITETKKIS